MHICSDTLLTPLQVNVVVMRGVNDDELCDFVGLTQHKPINVRFIEYMPFDGNVWAHSKMVPFREMMHAITDAYPQGLVPFQVCLLMCILAQQTAPRHVAV